MQIYSIGIFDQTAATEEEKNGPALLTDICEQTGGRMFHVIDVSELGDIAARISAETAQRIRCRVSSNRPAPRWQLA